MRSNSASFTIFIYYDGHSMFGILYYYNICSRFPSVQRAVLVTCLRNKSAICVSNAIYTTRSAPTSFLNNSLRFSSLSPSWPTERNHTPSLIVNKGPSGTIVGLLFRRKCWPTTHFTGLRRTLKVDRLLEIEYMSDCSVEAQVFEEKWTKKVIAVPPTAISRVAPANNPQKLRTLWERGHQ